MAGHRVQAEGADVAQFTPYIPANIAAARPAAFLLSLHLSTNAAVITT
ncbi:hypothetical protein BIFGAL_02937 [Bifidobacterium gallicum DSM 20093 = LMG 11596]|uniref:Uncharacterized protein n=1 Tax=Bifidobacterium gallicum DSM 20093 = LMG 11596 TaxID=561180 RepID=D1NT26_9BIFI|nr:hypothetical protein BIFGAL_02937 [Bifidobacterium gallicum DSM 20093 = LMG 11596]